MRCPAPEALAAWLDGELTENDARAAAAHVAGCAQCRAASQELRAVVAALRRATRVAVDAELPTRLRARLREASSPSPRRWIPAAAVAGVLAAVALAPTLRGPPAPQGLVARGAPSSHPARALGVLAFRHPAGHARNRSVLEDGGVIHPGDGFSFEVRNPTGVEAYVMVFARDAAGVVHWFHPAWRDAAEEPASVPLGAPSLTEGVTPEGVVAGPLEVLTLFTSAPLRVSEVERTLQGRSTAALAPLAQTLSLQSLSLNVVSED